MSFFSVFFSNRLDPKSFSARLEWSVRCSLSFLIAALCALFFKETLDIPFLLPILVLVVSNRTFGQTMHISQSMYRGTILTCLISTVFYFVPIISPKYWYLTLLYFFLVTLFLTVTLHRNAASRKLSLLYHVIITLFIAYKDETDYTVTNIWKAWLLVPITIIISSIGVLLPPIFAHQQLIFMEKESIKNMRYWLKDMIQLFECKSIINSKIEFAKLKKYATKSFENINNIYSLYPYAKGYELISDNNEMLNEERIDEIYELHYRMLAMYDIIKHFEYDSFHQRLLFQIKDSLKTFTDYLCHCFEDNALDDIDIKQVKSKLIRYNEDLLKSYQTARYKLLFDANSNDTMDPQSIMKSINAIFSFFYFLQTFTRRSIKYMQYKTQYKRQKEGKICTKCDLFCSFSMYSAFYPFPFTSWADFKENASPLIHWKSSVFIQSLSISIAMGLCGIFFIYPPAHASYKLGFWSCLTVAFVSDSNIGGTFHTSILRLEGTFLGVTCGYIILQLQDSFLSQLYGILLLTLWMCFFGYYRSHPSRGYSGLVAEFTASLIVIGYDSIEYEIEYYAIRRIEMTFIGIAAILIILQLFSPNNARKLLDKEMVESLETLKGMIDTSFGHYREMINASGTMESNDTEDEESKDNMELNLIYGHYDDINNLKESPRELYTKFKICKLKVTKALKSEKMLINASVFEPMLWKSQFNDALYFRLNEIQFWILRRVSQIDLCIRSLLLYIEKSDESQWLLNKELVHDITPFSNYLKLFQKCHHVIVISMQYFIDEIKEIETVFTCYQDVMLKLETEINDQWLSFEELTINYIQTKNNEDNTDHIISLKGALLLSALMFAVKKLMSSLSQFAECKIEYSTDTK